MSKIPSKIKPEMLEAMMVSINKTPNSKGIYKFLKVLKKITRFDNNEEEDINSKNKSEQD